MRGSRTSTLLRICNSSKGTGTESRGVPAPLRSVPFACVAFSREMAAIPPEPEPQQSHADPPAFYSYVLCASDQRGHIFAADFVQNRFWVVARTGVAATAICFNAVRRREVIVALADRSIQCYNIDNCQLIAKLPPMHMATPHHISVHPTRPLAITTSNTEAILWDTEDWERKRVMTSPTARVQQASFSHDGVSIIAAFEDGSIFFWTIDTFSLQWKITLDQMSDAASDAETNVAQLLASNRLSYFALSQNGELFVYGGISSTVYVWNMVERRLLHEILIPAFREMIIVQIAFVGSSSLPENRAGYEALLDQGVHPVFKDFRKRFPLRSDRAAKSMERVLSCLAFWSPIFENLEYLPSMVFPFVMLFSNDMFSGFEVAMTVIINWCQKWWDYYPNPPIDCLDMTEDMIAYHDPELLAHFVKYKVTSQVYAWSMMKTLFTEQFSRPDWLRLWDHLLTQPPSFMYHFVVAYILAFRAALLETTKLSDFKYPEFIVNYQSQMRDKIRSDEAEYVRKRRVADEMARLTEELRRDKKAWESADWKMDQMIERWWEQMMGEEDLREQSKSKMDALEKEKRISAMQQISDARRAFVDQQANTTEQHISNISRAVGRNRRTRDQAQNHEELERAFQAIETEWLQRRDEMVRMRNELSSLQQSHAQKLVDHSLDMGQAAGEAQ
nr:TBC1 domain member 31 [Polyrhizophydium stewartii]